MKLRKVMNHQKQKEMKNNEKVQQLFLNPT